MKSAAQFVHDVYYGEGEEETEQQWVNAVEARDREIRASALREAAAWFRNHDNTVSYTPNDAARWLHSMSTAAADAIPDAPAELEAHSHDTCPACPHLWPKPVPSRAELIELMRSAWLARNGDAWNEVLDALIKAGAVRDVR